MKNKKVKVQDKKKNFKLLNKKDLGIIVGGEDIQCLGLAAGVQY